ncbi:putative N-acetylated-alpha-linked acidic dipeptidase [Ornithodoros turicata]|uniref:putative N-acetylated-alpha-linked acidic dipeptidase n=1 Tax=Ornithodoros turicata TaxID=34597 RepID=UPI00313A470E
MSAQYRPYRDEDSAADSEPMTWQEQEPGSIQIYEKTTEDIRVVSHRHLVVGGIGVALIGVLAGLLVGYFAHTQHAECVRGKSVAIHAVYDADPTVRARLLPLTSAERIGNTVREFLSPEGDRELQLVKIIHDSWLRHGLESVWVDSYNVLLSFPDESRPTNFTVTESVLGKALFRSNLSTPDYRPYVAYAQSGETTGPIVYASHLRNQDIDFLHYNNVTLNGSVLVARLGSFPVQHQIENALLVGANALILYPDPAEYHPVQEGSSWWLPKDGIHTLSALADAFGDPQTPGYAATSTAYRPPEQVLPLPQIPIQTVSATIASLLIRNLGGPQADKTMYGQFPGIEYHTGPGPAVLHLNVHNILQNHSVDDVIGFIRGKVEPDRYVIVGSARDLWSQSQVGGMAVLQELTAVFGELLQQGWHPRRSILFCSWGGEGFNSVGSTEWLEEHMKILHGRAVAYIDVSTPVLGSSSLSVSASPLLYHTIFNATKQVPEPNSESLSVYDKWVSTFSIRRNLSRLLFPSSAVNMASDVPDDDSGDLPTFLLDPTPKGLLENYLHAAMLPLRPAVKPLEMRGGYASFFTRAGIPVVQMTYVDDLHVKTSPSIAYPRYRTQYDTFDFIQNEIDPSLKIHRAVTQVAGELLRDLADSMFLPFNLLDYAQLLKDLYFSLHIHMESITQGHGIDLSVLDGAIQNFSAAAFAFHQRQSDMDTSDPMAIRRVNDQLLLLERAFLDPVGLPRNSFKKHIVLSPSESPSYLDEMFPGIMDEFMLLLQKVGRPDAPHLHIQVLQQHYLVLVETIQQAADSLADVIPS